jgi:hypothetical protein
VDAKEHLRVVSTGSFKNADFKSTRSMLHAMLFLFALLALTARAGWSTIEGKALQCSSDEYKGQLGTPDTGAACFNVSKAHGAINYVLWRGGDSKGCYIWYVIQPCSII